MKDTKHQFEHVIANCRDLFAKKLHDYGAAWRIMRPSSVTDQIFIKANRIRSIETKGVAMVDEGIRSEFIAIVNYGIIGLVQLELGYAETDDMTEERALELYDRYAKQALELMLAKNHDYDEAWRSMRVSSYTDLILMKIYRTKQIEGHDGATLVSEGIDANYMDMIRAEIKDRQLTVAIQSHPRNIEKRIHSHQPIETLGHQRSYTVSPFKNGHRRYQQKYILPKSFPISQSHSITETSTIRYRIGKSQP